MGMKKGVKKKTAKKAVKKTTKKKVAKSKSTMKICIKRKILGQAPQEQCFILQDGRKMRTVYHLIDELETMSDTVFKDHVNSFKNDFANWIDHVFHDKNLAEEMREAETRMDIQLTLLKELVRELKKQSK